MSDDCPIIAPLNQFNYFIDTLFYQYLGTEQGSIDFRDFIDPAYTDASNGIEHTYQTILCAFRIDDAVGVQLDIIGEFVGLPRPTNASIGIGGFFGFDSLPNLPFDIGQFADGRDTDAALVTDDQYREFIKIKIIKNVWNGTRIGLKSLLAEAVDADTIEINNIPPAAPLIGFAFDTPGKGWDDGFFEGNIQGQSKPANYQIIFTGGTITQTDVDALILLDLIPTPQGVNMLSVTVVGDFIFTIEDESQFVIEDGSVFTITGDKP